MSFVSPVAAAARSEFDARTELLERAQAAVVGVISEAVEDAGSAATLGPVRVGSGVVIGDDGLVLTIGYLILEAERVDLIVDGERRNLVPGMVFHLVPGIYVPGEHVVVISETVAVTDTGCEVITSFPRDLFVV